MTENKKNMYTKLTYKTLKHKNRLPSCLTFLYHTLPSQTTISYAIFAILRFLEAPEQLVL